MYMSVKECTQRLLSVACYNQTDRISSFYKLNMCTRNIKYCDRCGTTKLIATLCKDFTELSLLWSDCFRDGTTCNHSQSVSVPKATDGVKLATSQPSTAHAQTEANGDCCTNSDKVAYGDKSEINCKMTHAYNHVGMNQVHHRWVALIGAGGLRQVICLQSSNQAACAITCRLHHYNNI